MNDNDERLIRFFKFVQSSSEEQIDKFNIDVNIRYKQLTKDNYKELLNIENLIDYYIIMKYSRFKCSRFMYDGVFERNVVFDIKKFLIYDFIRNENIIFTCEDGISCYEKYCNNKKAVLFLDPPYILCSSGQLYKNERHDIFEYLYYNNIGNCKARIYLILNDIFINRMLFKEHIKKDYELLYNSSHKKAKHIIISNIL